MSTGRKNHRLSLRPVAKMPSGRESLCTEDSRSMRCQALRFETGTGVGEWVLGSAAGDDSRYQSNGASIRSLSDHDTDQFDRL